MSEYIKKNYLIPATVVFIGLPLLLWAVGDFPRRTVLKESLSLLVILAFCQMLGLFFLARGNTSAVKSLKMKTVVTFHKIIGYLCVAVLLLHPIFIVIPRYFEAGVAPGEAFLTMLTTFESRGIVLGLIAWCLMLLLGITSLLRNRLPMKYTTWRIFHGLLSIVFIVLAGWHAIDLGRHTDLAMSIYIVMLAAGGILLLLKTYIFSSFKKRRT